EIHISAAVAAGAVRMAKFCTQISSGRVVAAVAVVALRTDFVGARVLVSPPVGEREALLIPRDAVATRAGLDFVRVTEAGTEVERAVVLGEDVRQDGQDMVEVLSGLAAGDMVVLP